jgi:arylsulfatase A-like enzyme
MTSPPAHLPGKRNLVIFLPDQQRADTLACYGGSKIHSFNLAKLASQSVIFDRAYVTQPVCSPSRASLMTGLWPHTTGCTQNGGEINPQFRVLPELFEDPHYLTAYMGKWHLRPDDLLPRAFHEQVSTQGAGDYSEFLISKGLAPDRKEGGFTELTVSNLPVELSQPKFLEDRACRFIQEHKNEPFILVVAFVEPHSPYNGPLNDEHSLSDIELDASAEQTLPAEVPLRYRLIQEWQREQALSDPEKHEFYFGITPEDYRRLKQKYLGLITLVDQSIGAILTCLERTGLSDRTVIVHTSDHGDMLGAHQLFGKEVMFEEAVRVPYLIRVPGIRPTRITRPVSHIDFIPTLLDLLNQPKPRQCAGKSLGPLIRGEELPNESVFIEWSPNWRVKIKGGTSLASRRLIRHAVAESTRTVMTADGWKMSLRDKDLNELYNLNDDPNESRNLFYDDQHAEVISRCATEISRWQELTRDKCKLPKV